MLSDFRVDAVLWIHPRTRAADHEILCVHIKLVHDHGKFQLIHHLRTRVTQTWVTLWFGVETGGTLLCGPAADSHGNRGGGCFRVYCVCTYTPTHTLKLVEVKIKTRGNFCVTCGLVCFSINQNYIEVVGVIRKRLLWCIGGHGACIQHGHQRV